MPDATPRPNGVSPGESSYPPSVVGDTSPPSLRKFEAWLGISLPSATKIVYKASRSLYRRQQDVEDLTQEVMTRVWKVSKKAGTERPHNPAAWLNTLTFNVFATERRHANTIKCGSGEIPKFFDDDIIADHSPGTEDSALKNIEHSKLRKAIAMLTPYQRELIIEHYYEEKTLQAMSILRGNIPRTTLKSQLDATMRSLRRIMRSESEKR
ncbi:sigma-70 family RNA polymerase sigma factor [Arthrobacter sp. NQ7]|uniref:RNA polymerase sigma factor n=1 Tax=Arthrobacter sp. NQ7 TaxID=3032303 RepID=UPI002410130A|nr:sigma-70 family RNA polymerase sigma factor [Arthrobacter sp. NQ7]MDJ0459812.1 sigma-70 family RNA polymerase sigma factor [Arthrobacter sp. NQ7]